MTELLTAIEACKISDENIDNPFMDILHDIRRQALQGSKYKLFVPGQIQKWETNLVYLGYKITDGEHGFICVSWEDSLN